MRSTIALFVSFVLIGCGSSEGVDGPSPNIPVPDTGTSIDIATIDGASADMTVLPVDVVGTDIGNVSGDAGTVEDVSDSCLSGSGCLGESCDENADCVSGICVMHLGERVCTQSCVEDCPEGWSCLAVDIGSADSLFVCVSNHSHLCQPCKEASNCDSLAGPNACVDYGVEGAFCGATCDDESPCPTGYVCQISSTIEGGESRQCVNEMGVCECTDTAIDLALSTSCTVENEFGFCSGDRVCGTEGLSLCDAASPGQEVCNGLDDDCDGLVDEVFCDDENPCTQDQCMGSEGCVFEPITGGACDDDDHCTELDTCQAGECLGNAIVCDDDNVCTDEACDPELGCQVTGPNTASCDDGNNCTINDQCAEGLCAPGVTLDCDDLNDCTTDSCGADGHCIYEPATGNCDDGNQCTTGDSCVESVCVATGNLDCDDDEACTNDGCDELTGCTNDPINTECDDGEICTVGDNCSGGTCSGTGNLECNDGDNCTTDSCEPGVGCSFVPLASCCGNSIVEEGEDCDDGNNDNFDGCNNLCVDADEPSECGNLGFDATPSHSSGGSSDPYLPYQMNNGLFQEDNCNAFSWASTGTSPDGAWFMFEWSTPQTIGGFFIDAVNAGGFPCDGGNTPAGRNLLSGTVQIWNGSGWESVGSWSGEMDDFKVSINPPVNTTKLRIFDITNSPGNGNSLIYEWIVYDSPLCLP